MTDRWRLAKTGEALTGVQAAELLRRRADEGVYETWLRHDAGPLLAIVTNGTRAMVMAMDEPGDPGEHAIDPDATGDEAGYLLSNGQADTYDNRDTVPFARALEIAEGIVDHGRPPAGIAWQSDR